jgi:hypothetical protein
MNIKSYKEQLLKSVMFNLSLSSKELFHSNFLAYLINNDNNVLNYLFNDFVKFNLEENIMVEREKDNFDLLIYDNQNCLIIENKVKSIPNITQLVEYEKKAKSKYKKFDRKFILITIYEPNDLNLDDVENWIILNYDAVLNGLKRYSADIFNIYLKEVILDYINFMDSFIKLFKLLEINEEQSIYINQEILEDLNELRIYDLFYKSRFERLKSDLKKSINNKYGNSYKLIESKVWNKLNVNEISSTYGFTRGTGLFEFKVPIYKSRNNHIYIIGVQLQNHSLKLLVQSTDKDRIKEVSESLNNDNLWFDFSILNLKCATSNRQKKEFCSYNSQEGLMLYKYQIVDDVSNVKIIEIFMDYLKYIIDNREKLIEPFSYFYD